MFTGIIEEIGYIDKVLHNSDNARIKIVCSKILEDISLGDSISVNGVCQTVIDFDKTFFVTELSKETLAVTTFSKIKNGEKVNLERAMKLNSRLGGHIVTGHVDCVSKIVKIEQFDKFYNIKIQIEPFFTKYLVKKGSVCVDGISLTVAEITGNIIEIAVIPHTFNNTDFQYKKINDAMNIEFDILAKYIEKMACSTDNKINENFLAENGFI